MRNSLTRKSPEKLKKKYLEYLGGNYNFTLKRV
jgi:hypothetical protein